MRFWIGLFLARFGHAITRLGWWIGGKWAIRRYNVRQRAVKRAQAVRSARVHEAWWQLLSMSEEEFGRFLDDRIKHQDLRQV